MATRLELDLDRFREQHARVKSELEAVAGDGTAPRIVSVTKYLSSADTDRLGAAGFHPLGENRANDLLTKTESKLEPDRWHFIGSIQRNKVNKIVPRVAMLHAVDSERLFLAVASELERNPAPLSVLIQVNVSGEESKSGLTLDEARRAVPRWCEHDGVQVAGLMTMAPLLDPEECRPYFRALRELRDEIRSELPEELADPFRELSMGMSNDYRIAAEEGATLVRLGRLLYT
ncbi:MAG: YggS family pyridoxal phosphate-dependent enzyme [Planctomycetota bacterium]